MARCDLLIRGGLVITMAGGETHAVRADVAIADGVIVAVADGGGWQADDVIDAADSIVLPGFVDGHRHMFSTLLRACAADASYEDYFKRIVLTYGRAYTPEDTSVAVELAMAEALETGITTVHAWEHNLLTREHAFAAIEAFLASGVRGRFSFGPPNDPVEIDRESLLEARGRWFTNQKSGRWYTSDGRVHLGLATRAVEFGLPEVWASEFVFGRENGLPLTAHCSGGAIKQLHDAGHLRPDLLPIHADHASPEEIDMLAAFGGSLCVAPVALARAGIGRSPVTELRDAGVPLCLSIDSTAGTDTTDMFQVMRVTLMIERAVHEAVEAFSPDDALRAATIGGARALGLEDEIGTLEPGKRADVIVVRADTLNAAPLNVPAHLVVLAGQPRNVSTVVVDGEVKKREGRLTGIDVAELVRRANQHAQALGERVGGPVH
jgi:5-methylthioadenosine/S-adenosylhomocysteine deaminase